MLRVISRLRRSDQRKTAREAESRKCILCAPYFGASFFPQVFFPKLASVAGLISDEERRKRSNKAEGNIRQMQKAEPYKNAGACFPSRHVNTRRSGKSSHTCTSSPEGAGVCVSVKTLYVSLCKVIFCRGNKLL